MLIAKIKETLTRAESVSSSPLWLKQALREMLELAGGTAPVITGFAPSKELGAPYNIEAINISDGDHILAPGVRAIVARSGGDVHVKMIDGSQAWYPIADNGMITGQFIRVLRLTTTAAHMVALR